MIKIIDSIDLTSNGACVFNKKWQLVHLRQGDMDGACAVYSLMMYLISIKVLTYKQVTNLNTSFKGNTSKGRLYKEFFKNEGLCRGGFYFSGDLNKPGIAEKLNHSFSKEVKAIPKIYNASKQNQKEATNDIKASIDENNPIMLGFAIKDGGHAILAIGYEEKDGQITKIFCLDPGYDLQKSSYWNTVLKVNDYASNKYCHQCITPTGSYEVFIDETLKIIKK